MAANPPTRPTDHAPRAPASDPWTTRRLLAWMADAFLKNNLDSPRLMGEILLSHVIACDRLRLYLDPDRPASPLELSRLRELVARALRHEPVQYLVSEAWFFGLAFHADPRVLIPRPSSETIIEEVLQHARATHRLSLPRGISSSRADTPIPSPTPSSSPHHQLSADSSPHLPETTDAPVRSDSLVIADICTGSGCLAVALLKHLPGARVFATDISPDALLVADTNARRHAVRDRLDLLPGDLLAALDSHPVASGARFDYIVSNPPYISDHEWPDVPPNVKHFEPHAALRAGPDALHFVRPLIEHTPGRMASTPPGLLLIELAASSAPAALDLARSSPHLADARIVADHEGLPRVLVARRA